MAWEKMEIPKGIRPVPSDEEGGQQLLHGRRIHSVDIQTVLTVHAYHVHEGVNIHIGKFAENVPGRVVEIRIWSHQLNSRRGDEDDPWRYEPRYPPMTGEETREAPSSRGSLEENLLRHH